MGPFCPTHTADWSTDGTYLGIGPEDGCPIGKLSIHSALSPYNLFSQAPSQSLQIGQRHTVTDLAIVKSVPRLQ